LQEFEHNPVEFFGTFFIGKMAGAFDDGDLSGLKVPAQRFDRRWIDSPIFAAPHQQGWNV